MVIDRELLEQAGRAGAALAEAERQALLARADYHTAVRRLHLAGGSLREIAETLSISHQRVQQIVTSAGGSWWRRVWSTRRAAPDAVCTWCGRPPAEVAKLIAGPRVYICGDCVAAAERVFTAAGKAGARPASGGFTRVKVRTATTRCAFCSRRADGRRSLVAARAGHVCTECLRVCREILDVRPHES